ncbi:hypothetical protein EV127DRAFT_405523 [Xylaria flabelliformis]|nr:hypothetical protein EV127DRAFT_405523 [Xylaria flabelliformis]
MIMLDSSHSSTTFSTSKRSACDRCRGHKLRCPRRESAAQSCSRCIRLGVHCVTSFQRPLGHSGNSGLSGYPRKLSRPGSRTTRIEPEDSRSMDTVQMPLPEIPSLSVREYEEYLSMPINGFQSCSDAFDPISLDGFSPPNSQCPGSEELDFDDEKYSSISESLMNLEFWPGPDDNSNALPRSTSLDTVNVPSYIQTQAPRILQCDERLSRLNLRLSARLEEHPRQSSSYASSPLSCSSPNTLSSEPSERWDSQCVGNILRDTADFISIIESYGHDETPSAGRNILSSECLDASSMNSGLGTIVYLEVLSAYLLIVATYRDLLYHLCNRFSIGKSVAASPAQSSSSHYSNYFAPEQVTPLPTMEVAGFQVQHSVLQTKLLLETIVYQLAQMEQLLGVPQSWRATDKRRYQGVGLFDNSKTRFLVDAVHLSNLGQSTGTSGGDAQLSAVASLRDHIRSLRSFLD